MLEVILFLVRIKFSDFRVSYKFRVVGEILVFLLVEVWCGYCLYLVNMLVLWKILGFIS